MRAADGSHPLLLSVLTQTQIATGIFLTGNWNTKPFFSYDAFLSTFHSFGTISPLRSLYNTIWVS